MSVREEEESQKNFYELLGVERTATVEQIKEAYREIARVLHPDSNFYSEIVDYKISDSQLELFKNVTAAYHTLINKEKRAAYDFTLPPELKGWVDDPNIDEEVEAKLVELGLKDANEAKRAIKAAKRKPQGFGTFGTVPQEPAESAGPGSVERNTGRQPIREAAKTQYTSKHAASKTSTMQSTSWMGVGRSSALSGSHASFHTEQTTDSSLKLYLLAGGLSFCVGIGVVVFLLF